MSAESVSFTKALQKNAIPTNSKQFTSSRYSAVAAAFKLFISLWLCALLGNFLQIASTGYSNSTTHYIVYFLRKKNVRLNVKTMSPLCCPRL